MKIRLNENEEVVKIVKEGLKRRGGYCPCRMESTEDTKCICKEFQEQTTVGPCHCGRFIKIEVQTGEKGEK